MDIPTWDPIAAWLLFRPRCSIDFVARNAIRSVIEFGVGDGARLQLAESRDYVTSVSMCPRRLFTPLVLNLPLIGP